MNTRRESVRRARFWMGRWGRMAALAALGFAVVGCKTMSREEMEEKYPFRAKYAPRWENNEVPYDETNAVDKFGRNIRDGFVGLFNNMFQGMFAAYTTGNYGGGYIMQKTVTFFGDAGGLLDDNQVTSHIFKGVFSRQALKYGSSAQDFPDTIGSIHETNFDAPRHVTLDYVGNKTFHTAVYGTPSGFATFGAVVASDFAVRPFGDFLLIFQMRKAGEKVDKAGLDMIQAALDVNFW